MLRLVIASSLLAIVLARSLGPNIEITPELLKIQLRPLLSFGQYIDEPLLTQIQEFSQNQAELEQFVEVIKKIKAGDIKPALSRPEFEATLSENAPLLFARYKTVADDYDAKVEKLSDAGKEFLKAAEQRGYDAHKNGPHDFRAQIDAFLQMDADFAALRPEVQKEFETTWPKAFAFYKSQIYSNIKGMMMKASKASDEDLQNYAKTFQSMQQQQ